LLTWLRNFFVQISSPSILSNWLGSISALIEIYNLYVLHIQCTGWINILAYIFNCIKLFFTIRRHPNKPLLERHFSNNNKLWENNSILLEIFDRLGCTCFDAWFYKLPLFYATNFYQNPSYFCQLYRIRIRIRIDDLNWLHRHPNYFRWRYMQINGLQWQGLKMKISHSEWLRQQNNNQLNQCNDQWLPNYTLLSFYGYRNGERLCSSTRCLVALLNGFRFLHLRHSIPFGYLKLLPSSFLDANMMQVWLGTSLFCFFLGFVCLGEGVLGSSSFPLVNLQNINDNH